MTEAGPNLPSPSASQTPTETEVSDPHPQPENPPEGGQELQHQEPEPEPQNREAALPNGDVSFSIWPPSQRTRDAVVNRLVETLCNPSPVSQRYGFFPPDDAASLARLIEDDSFAAAANAATAAVGSLLPIDDGMEILQSYSREISRRMLDAVKARSAASAPPSPASPPAVADETSSVMAGS